MEYEQSIIEQRIERYYFKKILKFINKYYQKKFVFDGKININLNSSNTTYIIIKKEDDHSVLLKIFEGDKLLYNLILSGDNCPIIQYVLPNIKYKLSYCSSILSNVNYDITNEDDYFIKLIQYMNSSVFHVLVVCSDSSRKKSDYNLYKDFISKNFFNKKKKPIITFLNGSGETFKFPEGVSSEIYNQYFDIIWFAGCNVLQSIFGNNIGDKIKRAYDILKEDGIVVFTEKLLYKKTMINKYFEGEIFKDNPTMKIEHIINLKENYNQTDEIIDVFKNYFLEEKKGDGITYYIKKKYINFSELDKQVSSLRRINADIQQLNKGKNN